MPSERHRTHRLECEGFAAEFRALLDRIVADTTAAIVWLREDEQRIEPDGTDCRRTWTAVRDRFERVPERDRDEATAWRVSTTTERDREALFDLVALTDGVAGATSCIDSPSTPTERPCSRRSRITRLPRSMRRWSAPTFTRAKSSDWRATMRVWFRRKPASSGSPRTADGRYEAVRSASRRSMGGKRVVTD